MVAIPRCRTRLLAILSMAACTTLWAQTNLDDAAKAIKARNFTSAQATLEQALKATPDHAQALALMGELHLANRAPEKAAEFLDKAIAQQPDKARYHLLRGHALGMRASQVNIMRAMTMAGDIRAAYEKAVELDPRDRAVRFGLFSFYLVAPSLAGGGLDKAQAFAEQTVALDGAASHQMKAQILQKQKKPAEAYAELKLAAAADPRLSGVNNNLGYLALELKQVDAALAHFQKQAELEPDNANSFDSLADGWLAKGKPEEAVVAYRKALALNPRFPSSLRGLGKALEQAGRTQEAIAHYRHCLQVGNDNALTAVVTDSKARLEALGVKS